MEDIKLDVMYEIVAGKKKLSVIYNKMYGGLHMFFSADSRMYDYIHNHTEEAFYDAIVDIENGEYVLNIASTMNFGAFEWKSEKMLLESQLNIFMPIIQKFMFDALTDSKL